MQQLLAARTTGDVSCRRPSTTGLARVSPANTVPRPMPTPAPPEKRTDIVVITSTRDSACAECGEDLSEGCLLRMERGQPLCLSCADLAHLVFLPSGDAALTRRASKYSGLHAKVVRFSRARKRNERQGTLVEESALRRAEQECLADSEARARARERRAEREVKIDAEFRREFARRIQERYPGCPAEESTVIAEHACVKHSGRVGRSAAAKEFVPEAIDLAVRAHVRHVHTSYDELLATGWDRRDARSVIRHDVDAFLVSWLPVE